MIVSPVENSFAEMREWIEGIPDQCDAADNEGHSYKEVFCEAICRPGDERVIEAQIAQEMTRLLSRYFRLTNGRIFWRHRLETEIKQVSIIVSYDSTGPDIDPVTDRACVMDHDWVVVKAYCRVFRADRCAA